MPSQKKKKKLQGCKYLNIAKMGIFSSTYYQITIFQLALLKIDHLEMQFDVIQSSLKDQVEVTLVWFISWRPSFFELYNRQSNCYIVNPL